MVTFGTVVSAPNNREITLTSTCPRSHVFFVYIMKTRGPQTLRPPVSEMIEALGFAVNASYTTVDVKQIVKRKNVNIRHQAFSLWRLLLLLLLLAGMGIFCCTINTSTNCETEVAQHFLHHVCTLKLLDFSSRYDLTSYGTLDFALI